MILARTVAHTVHVEAMLASMEPREFDAWLIAYNSQPWESRHLPAVTSDEQPASSLQLLRRLAGM